MRHNQEWKQIDMLTVKEIKEKIKEIGEVVTVENQYQIASMIQRPSAYPIDREFDSETEQRIVNLPESKISNAAWQAGDNSLIDRVVCTVATWQRNAAIRRDF